MRPTTWLLTCATLCAVCTSCSYPGLAPYGAQVLSEKEVAESLVVLGTLEQTVRLQPRDPEAWHRRGMIAWALRERDGQKPPIKSLDWTMLGRMADTSLRIAAQLRKQSMMYKRDVKAFLLSSGAVWTPLVTQGTVNAMERAVLAEARLAPTPAERAEGILRAARTYWRAYEAKHDALKRTGNGEWPSTGFVDSGAVHVVRAMVATAAYPDPHDTSDADYRRAEELFREAYKESPEFPYAFPQLAMALVAKNRWTELSAFATHHLLDANFDPVAWLALGLASQRLGDAEKAATAFDYALKNMPADTRKRLDRMQRVMRPSDTLRYAPNRSEERAFWMAADPLWSRKRLDARSEFLARIAFAELRWSLPEVSVRGAETDRGRIHVRYGPPDLVAGPDVVWAYDAGPVITFDATKGLGTASLNESGKAERLIESMPVRWDNVSPFRVDSMSLSVTRFRAGDSVDVHVVANAPIVRMQRGAGGRPVSGYVWMLTRDTVIRARDSVRVTDTLPVTFAHRVAPTTYAIRAEAVADGASLAARGTTSVVAGADPSTGFEMRGAGMSDLLIAAHVAPRDGAQARWSDFDITSRFGPVPRGGTVDVLWEIYELGTRDGTASYDVALTVAPIASRGDKRIISRFTRTVAPRRAVADHVTVGFGDTPPGAYTMTLDVTDPATGRTTTRSTAIVVR